jgi:hypothetical protein
MKTYAVADVVPPECDYITAGKEYEVIKDSAGYFFIIDASGDHLWSLWEDSAHLNGNNWRRVEREE